MMAKVVIKHLNVKTVSFDMTRMKVKEEIGENWILLIQKLATFSSLMYRTLVEIKFFG